jgi:GntR family transcriptional regulator/MocR family aminotransferase
MTTSPLLISIDRRSRSPLYRQLYEMFRRRIVRGELRSGEPVPSSRELARTLGISRLPVLNAYSQLLAEGYFETRRGDGTYVAPSLSRPARWRPRGERLIAAHAAALPPYQRPLWAEALGPFQIGQPDLRSFPIEIWSRLAARDVRRTRVKALQYGDPQGFAPLRELIAQYVRLSRGVNCDASQVLVTSGSQQGLDIAARVLLDPGAEVWVEDPGYWLVRHVVQAHRCAAVPVRVDGEGLDVEAGLRSARKARAAFVAPSHQYPLGVTMSAGRRMQLLGWAQREGAWIVEDDYDSEYRYDSRPIAALQGLDDQARVVYVGTFSKVMFPSLRLGYLIVPPDLVERFLALRQAMDLCPSHAVQSTMAEFMRAGHFARHVRRMRTLYASRRAALVALVERELSGRVTVMGDPAGMHIALLVPGCDDTTIAAHALREGLVLSPLSASCSGSPPLRGFVLGFGNSPESRMQAAVERIGKLIDEESRRKHKTVPAAWHSQ